MLNAFGMWRCEFLLLDLYSMTITTPEEFSFQEILHFLKRSPKEILHKVEGEKVFKLLEVDRHPVLVSLSPSGKNIKVDFLINKANENTKAAVRQYITEWFDLDKNIKPFYALGRKDPFLKSLVKKHFGYRIVGQPDLYESLIWAVLGQQINLQFAYTLKQRFVREYGACVKFGEEEYFLFPKADSIINLTHDDLLKLQFSSQKSRYTIEISNAFVQGVISKEKLKGLPLEEAKIELMKIKGVGNWTANYALMKTYRYADAFPLEDAGIHNALRKFLKLDRKPSLDEIRNVFSKYKGWEAYATLYLWRSL